MTLYKKKYRIETTRLAGRNYSGAGQYFVTVCTQKKMQWFGEIVNKKMKLNIVGEIVKDELLKTPQIRSDVILDAWCIMPNHIHVVIVLTGNVETRRRRVSTRMTPSELGTIMNQFKGASTKRIRGSGFPEFRWQSRFHDHIIRSGPELSKIRKYILGNPEQWDKEIIPWHADAYAHNL